LALVKGSRLRNIGRASALITGMPTAALPDSCRSSYCPLSAHCAFPSRVPGPIHSGPVVRFGLETTMTTESTTPSRQRTPWNKGRLIGQKRPLKPKDVWTVGVSLQLEGQRRDLAMFNLAIDSKLRGCDLVRLRVDDVFAAGRVRDRATVIQKKTGRPVQFEITEQTRSAIAEWLAVLGARMGQYLFPSRLREQPHLSTRQYARIVRRWVDRAGLDSSA
jgi:hypothetical protein